MQKEFDSILRSLLGPSGEDGHDGTAGVLLAVSGGIDSMCLADLVLHSSLSLRFAVAHCNFHQRGFSWRILILPPMLLKKVSA